MNSGFPAVTPPHYAQPTSLMSVCVLTCVHCTWSTSRWDQISAVHRSLTTNLETLMIRARNYTHQQLFIDRNV